MALEKTIRYRMRWMDFDRHGRVQPWAVLDLLQDVATVHADDLGIGHDDMEEAGVFWAIVRVKYEVVREPKHHQVVDVRTWPHSLSRFSFIRDYQVLDVQGDVLVKATSEWVLMDMATRKFASARDYYTGSEDFLQDRTFPKKPRKVAGFEAQGGPSRTVVPSYSDIDLNGHVNNAMYAKYVVDALDPGADGAIRTFQIDYRQEALAGVPLKVYTHREDGKVLVKGVNPEGETSFACAIE